MSERNIGFIQGVLYSAAMMRKHEMDAYDLIKATGIKKEDFQKYGADQDLEVLKEDLEGVE